MWAGVMGGQMGRGTKVPDPCPVFPGGLFVDAFVALS